MQTYLISAVTTDSVYLVTHILMAWIIRIHEHNIAIQKVYNFVGVYLIAVSHCTIEMGLQNSPISL
jgi:hypothetical protein